MRLCLPTSPSSTHLARPPSPVSRQCPCPTSRHHHAGTQLRTGWGAESGDGAPTWPASTQQVQSRSPGTRHGILPRALLAVIVLGVPGTPLPHHPCRSPHPGLDRSGDRAPGSRVLLRDPRRLSSRPLPGGGDGSGGRDSAHPTRSRSGRDRGGRGASEPGAAACFHSDGGGGCAGTSARQRPRPGLRITSQAQLSCKHPGSPPLQVPEMLRPDLSPCTPSALGTPTPRQFMEKLPRFSSHWSPPTPPPRSAGSSRQGPSRSTVSSVTLTASRGHLAHSATPVTDISDHSSCSPALWCFIITSKSQSYRLIRALLNFYF